jgi:hypothetical protein
LRRRRGKGGCDVEEEEDGDAAAAMQYTFAPVEAASVFSCGCVEERKGRDVE